MGAGKCYTFIPWDLKITFPISMLKSISVFESIFTLDNYDFFIHRWIDF